MERYTRLADETGRSRSFYINKALEESIDRLECEYGLLKDVEDYRTGRRIRNELAEIAELEDPRSRGKALVGSPARL